VEPRGFEPLTSACDCCGGTIPVVDHNILELPSARE
jgi:hypothetical protein